MALIDRACEQCGTAFKAEAKEVNRGYGRFCCQSCSAKFNGEKRSASLPPDSTCAWCSKPFRRGRTRPSKTGLYFCCRDHKDAALGSGMYPTLQPSHYGTAKPDYRQIAFAHYPARCNRCGYDKYPEVLQVHHRDEDYSNSKTSNLEILCPTCHTEHHFEKGTGIYGDNKGGPTLPEGEGIFALLS